MKRKRIWIPFLLAIVVLALIFFLVVRYSLSFTIGRCVVADNGSYLYVEDNSPVRMSNLSLSDKMFSELEMGDKILVIHDGVNESYPGQTGTYFCYKLESGTINDIPDEVIAELTELGWLQEEVVLENVMTIESSSENFRIALDIPENWENFIEGETIVGDGGDEFQPNGISIWPKGQTEGKISIQCHEAFGVCGTGLTQEKTTVAGMDALKGIYDNSDTWEFIVFIDFNKDFVILNEGADSWWVDYGSEATAILDTLQIEEK